VDGQSIESAAQLQQRVDREGGRISAGHVVRKGGARKTIPVRLVAAPSAEPQEVADSDEGGASRDAGPMERPARHWRTAAHAGECARPQPAGGHALGWRPVVSQVSPDGPSYQHLVDDSQGIRTSSQGERPADTLARRARQILSGVKSGEIVTLTVLSSTPDGWQQRIVRVRAK
jgi:hypothetical protein